MNTLEWHEVVPPEWDPHRVRLVARKGDLQAVITESYLGHVELAIYDESVPPDVVTEVAGKRIIVPNLVRFGRPRTIPAAQRMAAAFVVARR